MKFMNEVVDGGRMKEEWSDSNGTIYENLSYGKQENEKYDLYIPSNIDKDSKQSLMLFLHGGSWEAGTRKDD